MPKYKEHWENEYIDALPCIEEEPEKILPAWCFRLGYDEESEVWAEHISDNYAAAMTKRDPDKYVCDLNQHLLNGYGLVWLPWSFSNSSLVGQMVEDIFCVSHFAPSNMREGVRMLQVAAKSLTPMVFAVPHYLAAQLVRLGFRDTGFEVEQVFGGEIVLKRVVVNKSTTSSHLQALARYYTNK